jgi:hypothetical protein
VPVIAVQLECVPYGFLGKFQALRAGWDDATDVKLLMKHNRMFSAYVQALRKCKSFDCGSVLARALSGIEDASEQQLDELVTANNDNSEVRYSFGFRGNKSSQFGDGLIPHLHRLGPRRFTRDSDAMIRPVVETRRRATFDEEIPF